MMIFRPKPHRLRDDALQGTNLRSKFQPVMAMHIGQRGGSGNVQQAAFPDTNKVIDTLGVAAGTSATVWTPGGVNVIQLYYLQFWTSVAGSFQVMVNGAIWMNEITVVNVPVRYTLGFPGAFLYPTLSVLAIKNNTGGAADIHATALGAEVVA